MAMNERRKKAQRKARIHAVVAVAVLIVCTFAVNWYFKPFKDGLPISPAAPSPTDKSTSDKETEESNNIDPDLQEAVEQFTRFYESPPSARRTLMLNSYCGTPKFCSLIVGVDQVDTSEAAQGSRGVKIRVDKKGTNTYDMSMLDDERVKVLSDTRLIIKQPDDTKPYTVDVSYETVWIERDPYGWKIVGFLTQPE